MSYHCYQKLTATSLLLIAIADPISAAKTSFEDSGGCAINGDPDVFGLGIRISFYLQWFASIILLIFSPDDADITRKSAAAIILALYINEFQSIAAGNLVALEWNVLWLMTFCLNMFNWPASKNGYKKNGATIAVMLMLWASYYIGSPWVFFKGIDNGRKAGCDLRQFIFAPVSMYSHGFRLAFKVLSVLNAVILPPVFLVGALFSFGYWVNTWGDEEVREHTEKPSAGSGALALLQIMTGSMAIGFLEKTLTLNHVTFPGTSITDSGQLIPLLIGVFALISAVFASIRTWAHK